MRWWVTKRRMHKVNERLAALIGPPWPRRRGLRTAVEATRRWARRSLGLSEARLAWRRSLVFGLGVWMGCDAGVFLCEQHDDCAWGDRAGVCQVSGYCSFGDDSCDSGQRYGEHAGGELEDTCVDPLGDPEPEPNGSVEGFDEPGPGDDPGGDGPQLGGGLLAPEGVRCRLDQFDDDTLDPFWCTNTPPGIEISQSDGLLELDLVPASWEGGEQFGHLRNCDSVPLRVVVATVEVEQVPDGAPHYEGYLEVGNGARGVGVGAEDGEIYAYRYEGSSYSYAMAQRYEPEVHRFWRVRGAAGEQVVETSPDGVAWEALHVYGLPLEDAWGEARLGVWSDRAPQALDGAKYDGFELCAFAS